MSNQSTPSPKMKKVLTAAIVCKNEEEHIANCVESILQGCTFLSPHEYEVILVDSYSTDSTVEIASRYNITIYRLGKDWFHSCSAGRYTAVNNSNGEFTSKLSRGGVNVHSE